MAAQDHTLKIYVSENKSACSLIPVWPDLDVILVCRFDHGSISCCEMCLLKTQASRSCLACRPWLRHSGRMMFQTSAEPHIVALTKMEGRAKRRKEKKKRGGGKRWSKQVLIDLFFCSVLHIATQCRLTSRGQQGGDDTILQHTGMPPQMYGPTLGLQQSVEKKRFLTKKIAVQYAKKICYTQPKDIVCGCVWFCLCANNMSGWIIIYIFCINVMLIIQ